MLLQLWIFATIMALRTFTLASLYASTTQALTVNSDSIWVVAAGEPTALTLALQVCAHNYIALANAAVKVPTRVCNGLIGHYNEFSLGMPSAWRSFMQYV